MYAEALFVPAEREASASLVVAYHFWLLDSACKVSLPSVLCYALCRPELVLHQTGEYSNNEQIPKTSSE